MQELTKGFFLVRPTIRLLYTAGMTSLVEPHCSGGLQGFYESRS